MDEKNKSKVTYHRILFVQQGRQVDFSGGCESPREPEPRQRFPRRVRNPVKLRWTDLCRPYHSRSSAHSNLKGKKILVGLIFQ